MLLHGYREKKESRCASSISKMILGFQQWFEKHQFTIISMEANEETDKLAKKWSGKDLMIIVHGLLDLFRCIIHF